MTSNTTTGETNKYVTDKTNGCRNCTYWIRDDGREFITDPNSDVVNLARLTAYAEYGEAIHNAQAHHELSALKIDAPAFLDALPQSEHMGLHNSDSDPVEVDGIPLIRADG